MREFIYKANKTITSSDINLKDLPGSCGRMDILCRCVSDAFFLSHDIRRDVVFYAVLYGQPTPPVCIKFVGSELKKVSPDERSIAIFIKKALKKFEELDEDERSFWNLSTPGIYVRRLGFRDLILEKLNDGKNIYYLHKDGEDIYNINGILSDKNPVFVLGDHIGIGEEDEKFLENINAIKVAISPLELHANHCITVIHNILDRYEYGIGKNYRRESK